MPRKARITIAGAVHHVMSRGIDGMPIFRSDADRSAFLPILSNQLQKSGYLLYAWVLMPNHYHLVLRTTDYPLAACMRSVNSRYAQYFRKQLSTRGYLFQDRYKSIVTQDQNYVEELIRYVHLNPVRAGICKSIDALDSYPWCGHSVLLGRQDAPYQNTADVLRRFGSSLVSQRQAYRRFIEGREDSEHTKFKFLGFEFRPRLVRNNTTGQFFVGFTPAASPEAKQTMRRDIDDWGRRGDLTITRNLGLKSL